ncbi:very long chain fatty acid elongase AAEL008004-like [Ornithodoros turicata]|uniref:very long chain fatty acid elongase AAEL008004-like n=1 Tax=Ornithodoros turicata TaxID=34597 RepID=UPI0031393403
MSGTFSTVNIMDSIGLKTDPRTRDLFPLLAHPLFVFLYIGSYIYTVKSAGPRWMKPRQPFQILNVVRIYNALMVIFNALFFWIVLSKTYLPGGRYSIICQGLSKTIPPEDFELYRKGSWYLLVRYADFLDTYFFIMRKKYNQVSNLHVIHHVVVVFNGWFWFLYAPEGQVALGLCMNAFVHAVMYTYYFLSTFGPVVKRYLWWKKYLTMLQITQFIIYIVHVSVPIFYDCGYPKVLSLLSAAQAVLILVLFIRFYEGAYIKKQQ